MTRTLTTVLLVALAANEGPNRTAAVAVFFLLLALAGVSLLTLPRRKGPRS